MNCSLEFVVGFNDFDSTYFGKESTGYVLNSSRVVKLALIRAFI